MPTTLPPLLNANASFGLDIAETPDFSTISDLLKEMDRLGVAQALAWNKSAVSHAPSGNKRLLDVWQALPPAERERVIPSLLIAPPMLYERGAMDELVLIMKKCGLRALRAAPLNMGHDICHLEFLLEKLRRFSPLLAVSIRELRDPSALSALAARFPEMTFMLCDAMWNNMNAVFDLMRRNINVIAETSWMHSQGILSIMAQEFGAGRIVFGMGPRSHAGAAIAGLRHAGLKPAEERAIARGNLAALLKLKKPPQQQQRGSKPENSLWQRFMRGEPLGVPVLDIHAHLGTSSRWILPESDLDQNVQEMVERMNSIGIERSVVFLGSNLLGDDVFEGNAALERAAANYPDRINGMLYFHPAYAAAMAPKLDRWFESGFFIGFKILCSYWKVPVTDKAFLPAWEYADRCRLPVLIHTWGGGYDAPHCLADIAHRYADATFILGHSGGDDQGRAEAEDLARKNPNVILEWCGSFCSSRLWEDTLAESGNRQVVFGTDSVAHSVHWEIGRLLSLDVPDETLAPVLSANAQSILNRRRRP